jgi:hypothetical protein
MALCFNKKTWIWETTDNPELLTPAEDWVIDPVFSDEAACKQVGPANWVYTNNIISPMSPEEIAARELAEIRLDMWRKIQQERDRRKMGGVKVNGKWFHTDDTSRIQHIGLVLLGQNMPSNIYWKTMDGSFVLMTPTLAQQIFSAVAQADMLIFAKAEEHKANMYASQDPLSYNYLTGWPLIYGEE